VILEIITNCEGAELNWNVSG